MSDTSPDTEALRQQTLLRVLWRQAPAADLDRWLQPDVLHARGLQAGWAHASALARRALAAAYPALRQALGEPAFAALAQSCWLQAAPAQGDLALWGDSVSSLLEAAAKTGAAPHLPALARLEWAVHVAALAADTAEVPIALTELAHSDAAQMCLVPQPGTAVVEGAGALIPLWTSLCADAGVAGFSAPQVAAAAAGSSDPALPASASAALVWRQGWRVQVAAVSPAEAGFTARVLHGQALGPALDQHRLQADFDFQAWLLPQLQRGWLLGARRAPRA